MLFRQKETTLGMNLFCIDLKLLYLHEINFNYSLFHLNMSGSIS